MVEYDLYVGNPSFRVHLDDDDDDPSNPPSTINAKATASVAAALQPLIGQFGRLVDARGLGSWPPVKILGTRVDPVMVNTVLPTSDVVLKPQP